VELEQVPERKLAVKRIDDKVKRTLDRPDPSLLEQKFAATVKLDLAQWGGRESSSASSLYRLVQAAENAGPAGTLLQHTTMQNLEGMGAILNRRAKNFTYGGQRETATTVLNTMLDLVPAKRLSAEQVEFLKVGDSHSHLEPVRDEDGQPRTYRLVCQVYGATPEACLKNIETLLTVFDEGLSRPAQLVLADARTKRTEQFAQLMQERAELEKQQAEVEAQLKSDVDLTPELMIGLKQQQLNLEVEQVGTQAKIEAAQKLLTAPAGKDDVAVAQRAAVAAAKVEAEIALASIEARRAKLNELVSSVKSKAELTTKNTGLTRELAALELRASQAIRSVEMLDSGIAHHAPFPVVDNQVVIQPVEWTSP
jgi:hypothetical protein